MKNQWIFLGFCLILGTFWGCNETLTPKSVLVNLQTPKGSMKLLLYEQTPKHRNNFLTLIEKGAYDSTTFHRVIKGFLIQGGDFERSDKQQQAVTMMEAELVPELFHRKGAVVAARQGGVTSPQKKSDGSQFYIVQGRVHTMEELEVIEQDYNYRILAPLMAEILQTGKYPALEKQATTIKNQQDTEQMQAFVLSQQTLIEKEFGKQQLKKISAYQRKVYTTEGGLPMLDGAYTVFGQVVEGLEVIDSLASVTTNYLNRPIQPIIFTGNTTKIDSEMLQAQYGQYLLNEHDTLQ